MLNVTKWTVLKIILSAMIIVSAGLMIRWMGREVPATAAYLMTHPITFIAFAYAYYKSKDKFWLIQLLSVPFMLIADLYFLPSFSLLFPHGGSGMNTWAGIHLAIIAVGCLLYFKNTAARVATIIVLVGTALTNMNFITGTLIRPDVGVAIAWILQGLVFVGYLPYYGKKKGNYAFIIGSILQFAGISIANLYSILVSSYVTPITLAWTDKIIVLGRHPMAIGALQDKKLLPLSGEQGGEKEPEN